MVSLQAEELVISQKLNKEYAGITGIKTFVDAAVVLALGKDSPALKENRVAATQTLSGTGACRVATEFLSRFAKSKDLYMPNPTWANHIPLAKDAGLGVKGKPPPAPAASAPGLGSPPPTSIAPVLYCWLLQLACCRGTVLRP